MEVIVDRDSLFQAALGSIVISTQENRPKKYVFVKLSGIVINIVFTLLLPVAYTCLSIRLRFPYLGATISLPRGYHFLTSALPIPYLFLTSGLPIPYLFFTYSLPKG